jgi:hypothetical protein
MKPTHLIALAVTAGIVAAAVSTAGCTKTSSGTPSTTSSARATSTQSASATPSTPTGTSTTAPAAGAAPTTVQERCDAQTWPRPVPDVIGVRLDQAQHGELACWDNIRAVAPDGHDPINNPNGPADVAYRITAVSPRVDTPIGRHDVVTVQLADVDKKVTFWYLRSAPVPALCQHDPGQLRNGQLPPQEGHPGHVEIALDYNTGAYEVAFGDLTGGAGDAAMVTRCDAGGVSWAATVQLYTGGPQLDTAGPIRLGGVDLNDLTHGGSEIVTDLSISDGVAHVTWLANGPNDADCCPTVKMMADLRWDGSEVVAQNVRRAN